MIWHIWHNFPTTNVGRAIKGSTDADRSLVSLKKKANKEIPLGG